jgi:CheY-like chemotaxis protein
MAKMKIMLVDDDKDFLKVMNARLSDWGYDVIGVSNGKDAIANVRNKKQDIVILDYMMPDMGGVAVLREIRRLDKEIPVIMFTAYPDKTAIEATENLGVSAFIPKLSAYSDVQASLKAAIELAGKKIGK